MCAGRSKWVQLVVTLDFDFASVLCLAFVPLLLPFPADFSSLSVRRGSGSRPSFLATSFGIALCKIVKSVSESAQWNGRQITFAAKRPIAVLRFAKINYKDTVTYEIIMLVFLSGVLHNFWICIAIFNTFINFHSEKQNCKTFLYST